MKNISKWKSSLSLMSLVGILFLIGFVWADKPSIMTHFSSLWVGDPTDTASVTPGDNDAFVSGTLEVDGAVRFDSTVTIEGTFEVDNSVLLDGDFVEGDGSTEMAGFVSGVSNLAASGVSVAIKSSGYIFTNSGAGGINKTTLPEMSTAVGCSWTFVVSAAQFFIIEPADGTDYIYGITNAAGDAIRSNAIGDSITITVIGNDMAIVTGSSNLTNSADSWADYN